MKVKLFTKFLPYIIIIILCIVLKIEKTNTKKNYKEDIKIDSIYKPIITDSIKTEFNEVKEPKPIIVNKINPINVKLAEEFKKAKNKIKLYEEAIKENNYVEVFEDTLQTVKVNSSVQGKLLKQSITTILKPRKIDNYKTVIEKTIIKQDRSKIFLGLQTNIPTTQNHEFNLAPVIYYKTPKQNLIGLSANNNFIQVSYLINLF